MTAAVSDRQVKVLLDDLGRREGYKIRPTIQMIKSVSSFSDECQINVGITPTTVEVKQPFISYSSWLRSIPEAGVGVIVGYRSDTGLPEIESYHIPNLKDRVAAYRQKKSFYRTLYPGEHHFHSKGHAEIYMGQRGRLNDRGGIFKRWIDEDELEIGQKGLIHRRVMEKNQPNKVSDEERLGIVKRADLLGVSKVMSVYPKTSKATYGKEYLRILHSYLELAPKVLVDIREGNVFDDTGLEMRNSQSAKPLRMRRKYYTITDEETSFEIDEMGGYFIDLPTTGDFVLNLPNPLGKHEQNIDGKKIVNVGRSSFTTVTEDSELTAKNITDVANNAMSRKSVDYYNEATGTMEHRSPEILLWGGGKGEKIEKMVMGNTLMQAFNDMITNVFTVNAATWGIGFLGLPVALNPGVIASLNAWKAIYVTPNLPSNILSHFEIGKGNPTYS